MDLNFCHIVWKSEPVKHKISKKLWKEVFDEIVLEAARGYSVVYAKSNYRLGDEFSENAWENVAKELKMKMIAS